MQNDSAIRLVIAVMVAIACIAVAITGRPGSILGALVDAQDMIEDTTGVGGGGTVGTF